MNRKTLALPALAGLPAPLLAACGGETAGTAGGDAIVVGTTDRFTATADAPAPFGPAHAYDTGTWNVLRQTVQTLMRTPRGSGRPDIDSIEATALREGFQVDGSGPYTMTPQVRDGHLVDVVFTKNPRCKGESPAPATRHATRSSRPPAAPWTAPPPPSSSGSRTSSPTTSRCFRFGRASSTSPPATPSPASNARSTLPRTCSSGSSAEATPDPRCTEEIQRQRFQ